MSDLIYRLPAYRDQIYSELICHSKYLAARKDILIVAHNQLEYLVRCVESVRRNTRDYKLWVWDNGSGEETSTWISSQSDIESFRSQENLGFIVPNNRLAARCSSEYMILLNSDTEVVDGWDESMIAQIQQNGFSQVGYLGGRLDSTGKGVEFAFGCDIDYVPGWCFCLPREVYLRHGLFDEVNLDFAYCEDSDLSLRITEAGGRIYSLHLGLVVHHENKTILEVSKTKDCRASYENNHDYIRRRHGSRFKRKL